MAYFNRTLGEERTLLIGIVHGAIEPCNSNEYPSVYTRVNSPANLKWIMKETFDENIQTFDPRPQAGNPGNLFTCAQGAQISASLKCDGNNNCGDFSDEVDCDQKPVCKTKMTKDKPKKAKCQLPFKWNDELHTACPPDPDVPGEYWCSTKVTKSGKHVTGNWGFCSKGCPLEEGEYDYKPPEVDYGDYSDNDKSTGGRTEQILEAQKLCNEDLITAVKKGYVENAKFKLETCASPDAEDEDGYTALIWTVNETPEDNDENINITNLLIEKKANLDKDIDGYTALWQACETGHTEIVKMLLDAGANPNIKAYPDDEATTPLMEAARNGHKPIVRALVRNKKVEIDINAVSNEDKTAVDYADEEINIEILQILRRNGGKKASRVRGK